MSTEALSSNKNKNVKNIVFAVGFALLAAALLVGLLVQAVAGYSIGNLLTGALDAVKGNSVAASAVGGNAVAGAVLLIGGAAVCIAFAVFNALAAFGKKEIVPAVRGGIAALGVVLFCVCYSPLLTAMFHMLASYGGVGVALVINIVAPLLFVALLVWSNLDVLVSTFFAGANKKEVSFTSYVYPAIALLALVAFVLPLYSFTDNFVNDDGKIVLSVFTTVDVSLYGGLTTDGLINHRTAVLLVSTVVFCLAVTLVNFGVSCAKEGGAAKKYVVMKYLRLAFCAAYAVIFVFCYPSALNLREQTAADFAALGSDASAAMGVSAWAALILPALALLGALYDGVKEYLNIGDRLAVTQKRRSSMDLIGVVLAAVFSFALILILLGLALPYASYGAEMGVNLYAYIMPYVNSSAAGLPDVTYLFLYVLAIAVIMAGCLALLLTGSKRPTLRKWELFLRVAIVTATTVLFAVMHTSIADCRYLFSQTLGTSGLTFFVSGDFLTIASIMALVTVWLEAVYYVYNVFFKNRLNKKK